MIVITAVMQFGNFDLRTRATSVPANITVDASAPLPDTVSGEFMRAFAQGGEEKLNMLAPAVSKIAALKPKVIRIDHVYDFFVTADRSGGTLSYDFSRLDGVVRSILDTGAVPMLSLGYMPGELSDDGTVTGKPRNWQEWTDLVRQTVGRYSGKGGLNVAGIYYEVWNEPDLETFGKWNIHRGKDYKSLYLYSSLGAQKATNVNRFFFLPLI